MNAEYSSAALSTAVTAKASSIDLGLDSFRAEKYSATPSRMPTGSEAIPRAATSPSAIVTTQTAGSGQRRITMTGTQSISRMSSGPPC